MKIYTAVIEQADYSRDTEVYLGATREKALWNAYTAALDGRVPREMPPNVDEYIEDFNDDDDLRDGRWIVVVEHVGFDASECTED